MVESLPVRGYNPMLGLVEFMNAMNYVYLSKLSWKFHHGMKPKKFILVQWAALIMKLIGIIAYRIPYYRRQAGRLCDFAGVCPKHSSTGIVTRNVSPIRAVLMFGMQIKARVLDEKCGVKIKEQGATTETGESFSYGLELFFL